MITNTTVRGSKLQLNCKGAQNLLLIIQAPYSTDEASTSQAVEAQWGPPTPAAKEFSVEHVEAGF